ncbi:SIS domain-containing protein [Cohnella sp. REN36]|uniref:SIS domain-containing protein n=1 Tax=Cohnella sp. REN36 TaxID=2887347 RepID=UPI001D14EC03|nr:SIS domain-containing protein [Cohnella sp. REN36]MCC3375448.1 SIS domain-containing protein [Cohnella sp. REN36]
MSFKYLSVISHMLSRLMEEQGETMNNVVSLLENRFRGGGVLHVFGAGHAGIVTEELFYRAGGWIPVNPVFADGMMLNTRPITKTTALERLHGYAEIVMEGVPVQHGDVLLVHSVSGRNALPIEIARWAKSKGIPVIALTSTVYSSAQSSRHCSGRRLFELADYVLDNMAEVGDAAIPLPKSGLRTGPTSSVIGIAILHAILSEVAERMENAGLRAPLFVSANIDGGEEANRLAMEPYKGRLSYLS